MSYCRFSSDDFQCDVYVYDSEEGIVTHVARARRVVDTSTLPALNGNDVDAILRRHRELMRQFDDESIPIVPIGLSEDGKSFVDDTPGEAADRLETLRAMGYRVPQHAIDVLREEHVQTMSFISTSNKKEF